MVAKSQIDADGTTVDTRQLTIAANSAVELVWQLPPGTRGARLRVDPASGRADALSFDNEAYVVTRDASQRRILLVSANPGDLGRALNCAVLGVDQAEAAMWRAGVSPRSPPGKRAAASRSQA